MTAKIIEHMIRAGLNPSEALPQHAHFRLAPQNEMGASGIIVATNKLGQMFKIEITQVAGPQ